MLLEAKTEYRLFAKTAKNPKVHFALLSKLNMENFCNKELLDKYERGNKIAAL